MSVPDTSLVAFKAIVNFTTNLSEVFGEEHKSVKLYNHLLSKTTLAHENAIQKHIDIFRQFVVDNRDAILKSNHSDLLEEKSTITYSNRVYLDMKEILSKTDKDTRSVIWQHLLIISALLDPTGRAKQILQEQKESKTSEGEADFLNNIIGKIENNVDLETSNPMEAVSSIMQSGVFNELVQGMGSGLQDGSLDIGKLMGTVQNMVTQLNNDAGEEDQQSVDMINTMMQNLNSTVNDKNLDGMEDQEVPDISKLLGPMVNGVGNLDGAGGEPNIANMLGPMMGMLGNMPNNNNNSSNLSIQDQIENEVAKAKQNGDI